MLGIDFGSGGPRTVLCVGAHCDDIEIGCGGTLLVLAERYPNLRFHWLVFTGDDVREAETRSAAHRLLAGRCDVTVRRFRGSYLPADFVAVKDEFERVKSVEPDLVLSHFLNDRHQDHRTIAELTWNTFRDHLVLEYEIPKFEGDLGHPNVYVPLSAEIADAKVAMLLQCFPSQLQRRWFRSEVFRGLMNVRGLECNAASGLAEAFHARKLSL